MAEATAVMAEATAVSAAVTELRMAAEDSEDREARVVRDPRDHIAPWFIPMAAAVA